MIDNKKLIIYYFSGTGNAKQVAQWISDIAAENHITTMLVDISKINRKHISKPDSNTIIGFCAPTHGFNYPPVMMHFIFRFPKTNNNQAFVMNTRAGVKLSKIFLPGLSGIALLLASLILFLKGYTITGMRSIDLPSNWISLHPSLRQKSIISIFKRNKEITKHFAKKIIDGKKNYRALFELPVDIFLMPIAVLYYFMGRFIFAKSFYASRACNNCGLCINQCPIKAIRFVDNRPFWSYTCESCMHCMNTCPEKAIETAHGYIIGLLVLLSTLGQSFLYSFLLEHNIYWFSDSMRFWKISRLVLEMCITFFALIVSYWLIHYLRKIKLFDLLITYTSLTFYKFWGRYNPPKRNIELTDKVSSLNN